MKAIVIGACISGLTLKKAARTDCLLLMREGLASHFDLNLNA